jgi:soluble lytic murein transglycosylase-like protein
MDLRRTPRIVVAYVLAFGMTGHVGASCYREAAQRYGVSELLLRAIARTESGENDRALNRNKNGTFDIGRMQINSGWLKQLSRYGITIARLADPCTNVMIGAWILSSNTASYGMGWEAVGAYNVGCRTLAVAECQKRRAKYAWAVHNALYARRSAEGHGSVAAPSARRSPPKPSEIVALAAGQDYAK